MSTPTEEQESTTSVPSDTQPEPSNRTRESQQRLKKRKATKLEKVEKLNKTVLEKFMEEQEKSRISMTRLEEKRMKWEQEQAKREDEKEQRFMDFMKQMFTMVMQPQAMHGSLSPQAPPMPPVLAPSPSFMPPYSLPPQPQTTPVPPVLAPSPSFMPPYSLPPQPQTTPVPPQVPLVPPAVQMTSNYYPDHQNVIFNTGQEPAVNSEDDV